MTNDEFSMRPDVSAASLGVRHSFLIRLSSFVIFLLTLAIRAYRLVISPAQTFLFGPTGGCRFTPTCSQYALEAIRQHGPAAGAGLALRRICRCHPWGGCGHDPVPEPPFAIRPSSFEI